jgi:hypothetical protein
MKKLNLQLGSIKEMLTKEQMKNIDGGYAPCCCLNVRCTWFLGDTQVGYVCSMNSCDFNEDYQATQQACLVEANAIAGGGASCQVDFCLNDTFCRCCSCCIN